MALDRELVGRSYPPSAVYEVGRAKIAEFATAIGEDDPVHRDADAARAAGHPDVIAPPTSFEIRDDVFSHMFEPVWEAVFKSMDGKTLSDGDEQKEEEGAQRHALIEAHCHGNQARLRLTRKCR